MADIRWTVECPTCHAKPGQPCRNPQTLVPRTYQHKARANAAVERARDAEVWAALGAGEEG